MSLTVGTIRNELNGQWRRVSRRFITEDDHTQQNFGDIPIDTYEWVDLLAVMNIAHVSVHERIACCLYKRKDSATHPQFSTFCQLISFVRLKIGQQNKRAHLQRCKVCMTTAQFLSGCGVQKQGGLPQSVKHLRSKTG